MATRNASQATPPSVPTIGWSTKAVPIFSWTPPASWNRAVAGRCCAGNLRSGGLMARPAKAMLLAAGLGTRMRPITLNTPKPLVEVAGKALIDWTLDSLRDAGVTEVVTNVHHLADQLCAHLSKRARPRVIISDETAQLLDTGGGVLKALPLLGTDPFFCCNCDAIVTEAAASPSVFSRIADGWDDARHDVLMLVTPTATASGYDGLGDFFVETDGTMCRRGDAAGAPYVYTGVSVVHPRVLAVEKPEPFSINRVWDRALAAGRMQAMIHDGGWYHVGTPDAVTATTALLR
ncbi:MAG TPA: nucleotidyltransferase family protein [Rhizomicrobium sp.]|nr:nucleotidyltransferase family protein [Rhizomicrobium sp.]